MTLVGENDNVKTLTTIEPQSVADGPEEEMVSYDLTKVGMRERATLLEGLIFPRPIAWISTVSVGGRRNLAPFSFFNLFSPAPPTIVVAPGTRPVGEPVDGQPPLCEDKHTLANIRETGEFVVSLITEDLLESANATSADVGPGEDEWLLGEVSPRPSEDVGPPMVAESPASFECRVLQIVDLDFRGARTNALVIARITRCHVAAGIFDEGGRPDPTALRLVGRIGGPRWCRTTDWIELARPQV